MTSKLFHLDEDSDDSTSINFVLTDEGLIMDAFDAEGQPLYTEAMTAMEWFHWMAERDERREVQETYGVSDPALVMRRTRNLKVEMPKVHSGPTVRKGFWSVWLEPSTEVLGYFADNAEASAKELAEDAAKRIAEAIGAEWIREL